VESSKEENERMLRGEEAQLEAITNQSYLVQMQLMKNFEGLERQIKTSSLQLTLPSSSDKDKFVKIAEISFSA